MSSPSDHQQKIRQRAATLSRIALASFLIAWAFLVAAVWVGSWRLAGVGLLFLPFGGACAFGGYALRYVPKEKR